MLHGESLKGCSLEWVCGSGVLAAPAMPRLLTAPPASENTLHSATRWAPTVDIADCRSCCRREEMQKMQRRRRMTMTSFPELVNRPGRRLRQPRAEPRSRQNAKRQEIVVLRRVLQQIRASPTAEDTMPPKKTAQVPPWRTVARREQQLPHGARALAGCRCRGHCCSPRCHFWLDNTH